MSEDNLEIHYADEWAALYVNGKLETVGDSYLAEEKALALLGVKTVQDDAFMRGQSQREGVAKTLQEVSEYKEVMFEEKRQAINKLQEALKALEAVKNALGNQVEIDSQIKDLNKQIEKLQNSL